MLSTIELIQFYMEQYELDSQRKRKNPGKTQGLAERLDRLSKTLKRANRLGLMQLADYHRQLHNMTYHVFRQKNGKLLRLLEEETFPSLVRLDTEMLLPEEREDLDQEFLDYLRESMPGAICFQSLFQLYTDFRQFAVKSKILDLVPSRPETEFPEAMEMERHFILHIGPTNSGKTFQALERLKDAKHGVYLGPLRLLALEVYEKMNEVGTPCTMLTGQECIMELNSRVTASTVEMLDIDQVYDVAVIDEAQMVSDPDRGHSWTRALLGLRAKEIHVCLAPAAEQVVEHLIGLAGDNYEVRRYERKTKLVCEKEPFIFPDDVKPGDALIVFSKKSVLDIAGRLEEHGVQASVIYGSLPPEIRRRQTHLFATGKTKVVVSTDAIGMGLNLPVRRIVFIQDEKFDGTSRRKLQIPEIKQIAGRAGRFGIYHTGYVNAMGEVALDYIRDRYDAMEEPVTRVSLGFPQVLLNMEEPLDVVLNIWHSVEPDTPFEKVSIEETLFLYEQAYRNKEYIEGFADKHILYKMVTCPIDIKDPYVVEQWLEYCMCYNADVSLPHPDLELCGPKGIMQYETYYKELDLYYQFSQRLGKIVEEEWLETERERVEGIIMQYLARGKKDYIATCRYCGRKLPVGTSSPLCSRCREYRRERDRIRDRRRKHGDQGRDLERDRKRQNANSAKPGKPQGHSSAKPTVTPASAKASNSAAPSAAPGTAKKRRRRRRKPSGQVQGSPVTSSVAKPVTKPVAAPVVTTSTPIPKAGTAEKLRNWLFGKKNN